MKSTSQYQYVHITKCWRHTYKNCVHMKTKLVIPELRTVYFVLKQYETKQFDKAHYHDFQVCRLQEAVADLASVKINYHSSF